ncbi:MAG: P27 family phage terminase small subunit [Gemmatimonadales bacterium]
MPPLPKPASRRQRRNRQAGLVVAERAEIPRPPRGMLKATRDRWAAYWNSDVSRVAQAAHLPLIERLFIRYDERDRVYRQMRKVGRLVKGSQGQPVRNPLLKYIDECDKQILMLEDRLGLSPRAMLQLGNTFADAVKSLDEVNRALETDDDEDPRLKAVR